MREVMGFDSLHLWDVRKSRRTVSVLCDRTHVYRQRCRWDGRKIGQQSVHAGAAFFAGGNWQKPWPVQVVRLAKRCKMQLASKELGVLQVDKTSGGGTSQAGGFSTDSGRTQPNMAKGCCCCVVLSRAC